SNARYAAFYIVMAVTDPEVSAYKGMSMFIVPADAPGIEIIRHSGLSSESANTHSYIRYNQVRVPADHILGNPGQAFVVAQTRLGGGRIHHAMRCIGQARRALDMMCERVVSRHTQGTLLAEKQMVQEKIADSWIELEQFRLLVLRTAWRIDKLNDYRLVRKDISAVKAAMPKVLHDIAARALHLHGPLGVATEMPFASQVLHSFMLGLADGPTEVHKVAVAREVLGAYQPSTEMFPAYPLPRARAAAEAKYRDVLAQFEAAEKVA